MIGAQEGIFNAGEVFLFSDRPKHIVQKKSENCSCNNRHKEECPFWSAVNSLLKIDHHISLDELNVESSNSEELKLHNHYLFNAIAEISKCRIIVDASKVVSRFAQLKRAGFTVVPILFRRNPCATVYSWIKRDYDWWQVAKYYPDYYQAVSRETSYNNSISVTYESFIDSPHGFLEYLLRFLGFPNSKVALDWSNYDIHILKGNAVKQSNSSALSISTEWQNKLTPYQKLIINLKAIPCSFGNYWFFIFWSRFMRLFVWRA